MFGETRSMEIHVSSDTYIHSFGNLTQLILINLCANFTFQKMSRFDYESIDSTKKPDLYSLINFMKHIYDKNEDKFFNFLEKDLDEAYQLKNLYSQLKKKSIRESFYQNKHSESKKLIQNVNIDNNNISFLNSDFESNSNGRINFSFFYFKPQHQSNK